MDQKIALGIVTLQYVKRTVDCLLNLADAHLISAWCIPESSLIPQCRNAAINLAYKNCPDFTHFLFIDDDMCGFGPQHVWKLVEDCDSIDDCDVMSALVTARKPPYKIIAHDCNVKGDAGLLEAIKEKSILESKMLGMAFTVIKRHVLDQLSEIYTDHNGEDKKLWFTMDRRPRPNFEVEKEEYIKSLVRLDIPIDIKFNKAIEYGQMSHIGTSCMGEDAAFCHKVRQAGYKLFTNCGVPVGHIGEVAFDFRHAFKALGEHHEKNTGDSTRLISAE